jgi:3-hydroxyacyl-[acyl-carrier-protein] dehydratase
MQIEASCIHLGSGYGVIKAAIRKDGNIVCDAELKFRQLPFATPALKDYVTSQGLRLGLIKSTIAGA